MPASHTNQTVDAFLLKNYPLLRRTSNYLGTCKHLSVFCTQHQLAISTTFNNLQIQNKKGNSYRGVCPECAACHKPKLCGDTNPAFKLAAASFQDKLNEKFGKNVLVLVDPYKGQHTKIRLKHTCGEVFQSTPKQILSSMYPCSCVRIKALVPFASLSERDLGFIRFAYTDLCFSVEQISLMTGLLIGTIRKALDGLGIQKGLNSTNGKRRTLESLRSAPLSSKEAYYRHASVLTGYMYRAYADEVDPNSVRGAAMHLDHRLSRHDGYTKYSKPLDLRILCHPANFKMLDAAENIRKSKNSSVTLKVLKKQIAKFEARHGPVVFPDGYTYTIERDNPTGSGTTGLRVLALDPGTSNFGVFGGTLLGVKSIHRVSTILSCMLTNPITDLSQRFIEQQALFVKEIRAILEKVDPDVIVVERFQTRGLQGTTVELVSAMIGIIAGLAYQREAEIGKAVLVRPIVASQWKNAVNRCTSLDEMYEKLGSKKLHHRLDALLIGLYAFPAKNPYEFLTAPKIDAITSYIKTSNNERKTTK